MKKFKLYLLSLLFLLIGNFISLSQSNTPCGGSGAPNLPVNSNCNFTTGNITGGDSYNSNNANFGSVPCGVSGEDVWYSFTAPTSGNVTIQTQSGSITDLVMAVYESDCSTYTNLDCDDDSGPGFMPVISNTGLTPGQTYYIRLWEYGGGTGNFNICITEPSSGFCSVSSPFCTSSPSTFPASTNTTAPLGPDYGCLLTQPNPAWFYLEMDTGGDVDLEMSSNPLEDIDFIIWGPAPDLTTACNTTIYNSDVACSYSPSGVETGSITGATVGEIYILLVTNYSGDPTDITITQTGDTGTTDCSILPIQLVSFTGERSKKEDRVNILQWTTAVEINNNYFTLEHSIDGYNWEVLHRIPGEGTSNNYNDYQYFHQNPSQKVNYYRLSQTDYDGTKVSFSPISVDNRGELLIESIYDLTGRKVDKNYRGVVLIYYSDGNVKRDMSPNCFQNK